MTIPSPLQEQLNKIEAFGLAALSVHGGIMLVYSHGAPWQWLMVGGVALLGVLVLRDRRGLPVTRPWRVSGLVGLTWVLMLTTGGTGSFFLFWNFMLVALYPVLLEPRLAVALPVIVSIAYVLLLPVSEAIPVVVVLARAFLLLAIGFLVRFVSSASVRQALGQHRIAELERANALIDALGHVAAQVAAMSDPDQVMNTLGTELKRLGLQYVAGMLDPAAQVLAPTYHSLEPLLLSRLEQLIGVAVKDLRVTRTHFPLFAQVVEQAKPVFSPERMTVFSAALPHLPKSVVEQIIQLTNLTAATPSVYLPLVIHDQVLGVMFMWGGDLRPNDIPTLSLFASQIAVSLEIARLHERLKTRRIEEQETLLHFSQTLGALNEPGAVLEAATRSVQQALAVEIVSLMTPDISGQFLVLASGVGWAPDMLGRYRLDVATSREGFVYRNGEPVQQPDMPSGKPFPCPAELKQLGVMSSLTAPLRAEGRILGTLCAHSRQQRDFTADEVRLLSLIASATAQAFERTRLFQAEHQQRQLAEALRAALAAGATLSAVLDFDTALDRLLDQLTTVVPYDAANIMLVDQNTGRITTVRLRGYKQFGESVNHHIAVLAFTVNATPNLQTMLATRRPLVIPDTAADPGWIKVEASSHVRSWAGAPIVIGGEVVAFFSLDKIEANYYQPEHGERLAAFAGQAALALQNARLFSELRTSEERFRTLVEQAADGIFLIDSRGRYTAANPSALTMLGYSLAELIGKRVQQLIPPADRPEHRRWLAQLLEGHTILGEQHLIRKDGALLPVEISARRLPDGQLLGIARDITERKRDEETLRIRSRQQAAVAQFGLRALTGTEIATLLDEAAALVARTLEVELCKVLELLPDGQALLLRAGVGWQAGRVGESVMSAGQESQAGFTLASREPVIVEDLQTERRFSGPGLLREHGVVSGLSVIIHGHGQPFGVLGAHTRRRRSFSQDDINFLQAIANILAEAVERKRAEASLQKLSSAVEQTADSVIITDRSGVIQYVNPAFETLTGYTQADVVGRTPRLLKSGQHPKEFFEKLWQTILTGQVFRARFVNHKQDGNVYHELKTITPLRDTRGNITHFVSVGKDITGEIQRERELEVIVSVATALRTARTRAEMLPVILHQTLNLIQADGAALVMADPAGGELVVELAMGDWAAATGARLPAGESISGDVINTGRLYQSNDLPGDPRLARHDLMGHTRAAICAPLMTQQQAIGAMWIARRSGHAAFTIADLRLVTAIGDMAANALQRAAFHEQVQQRLQELIAINEASQHLQRLYTPETLTLAVIGVLEQTLKCEYASVALVDEASGRLTPFASSDSRFVKAESDSLASPAMDIADEVAQAGQSLIIPDVAHAPRYSAVRKDTRSVLCVPLRSGNRALGVINLESSQPNAYTPSDQRVLETVAAHIAIAVENARLYAKAQRRLEHVQALHNIDVAITSSPDLRFILNILLDQVSHQLRVAAAAVRLLNPRSQTLTYAAGRGFRSLYNTASGERLGESVASQAVLTRQPVHLTNMPSAGWWAKEEAFVAYCAVPLIAKGLVWGVLEVFNRSALATDAEWLDLLNALAAEAAIAVDNTHLFEDLQRSNMELTIAYDSTLEGWARALELRDKETEGHAQRVVELTLQLARAMGVEEDRLVHVRRGALLHDIGKMGIPDNILLKPGPLTDDEWAIMRQHPVYAYDMLSPITFLRPALDIPYCHHEKWDGTGYPRGLKGEAIPLEARMFSIIDVWDALRSDRPYRKSWTEAAARQYLREQADRHFDARVVEMFLNDVI